MPSVTTFTHVNTKEVPGAVFTVLPPNVSVCKLGFMNESEPGNHSSSLGSGRIASAFSLPGSAGTVCGINQGPRLLLVGTCDLDQDQDQDQAATFRCWKMKATFE